MYTYTVFINSVQAPPILILSGYFTTSWWNQSSRLIIQIMEPYLSNNEIQNVYLIQIPAAGNSLWCWVGAGFGLWGDLGPPTDPPRGPFSPIHTQAFNFLLQQAGHTAPTAHSLALYIYNYIYIYIYIKIIQFCSARTVQYMNYFSLFRHILLWPNPRCRPTLWLTEFAVGRGVARFERGTAVLQSSGLPLSHLASWIPNWTCL